MSLFVLSLLGCGHPKRMDSLVEAGWTDVAAHRSRGKRRREELTEIRWRQLDLVLSTEVVPVEALGIAPRGYGEEWVLVAVGLDRRPGVADDLTIDLSLAGWSQCDLATCDVNWVQRQQLPAGLLVLHLMPPSDNTSRDRGLLGELVSIGTVVGSLILLPTAFLAEGVGVLGGRNRFTVTKFLLDSLRDTQQSRPTVVGRAASAGGLHCQGDTPCSGTIVLRRAGGGHPLGVSVDLRSGSTTQRRSFTLGPAEGTLEEVLARHLPSEGVQVTP